MENQITATQWDKSISVCFTGHRSQKLPWRFNENALRCRIMKLRLKREIYKALAKGYRRFYCGMALGFDIICAETLLSIKKKKRKKFFDIEIVGAIPCKNQDCKWHPKDRERYRKILSELDYVYCKYETYLGAKCIYERNKYMVDNSSLMMALYDGTKGGTKWTIRYAFIKDLDVIIIKP